MNQRNSTFCIGGVGKVFLYSSNLDIATKDRVTLVYRIDLKYQ